jgi:hypothetical protein
MSEGENRQNLFSDTRRVGGGQPYPAYYAYQAIHAHFRAGTRLFGAVASAPDLLALDNGSRTLLINQANQARTVAVGSAFVRLTPYEVRLV